MKELKAVCMVIYGVIRTVVTRRRFLRTKVMIVQVQKMVKVCTKANRQPVPHIIFPLSLEIHISKEVPGVEKGYHYHAKGIVL